MWPQSAICVKHLSWPHWWPQTLLSSVNLVTSWHLRVTSRSTLWHLRVTSTSWLFIPTLCDLMTYESNLNSYWLFLTWGPHLSLCPCDLMTLCYLRVTSSVICIFWTTISWHFKVTSGHLRQVLMLPHEVTHLRPFETGSFFHVTSWHLMVRSLTSCDLMQNFMWSHAVFTISCELIQFELNLRWFFNFLVCLLSSAHLIWGQYHHCWCTSGGFCLLPTLT